MVGKTISHYSILEELGHGGMGVVYKAQDTRLDRIVALKFLPSHLGADPEAKERFMIEARTASALDHPNICTIHDIGTSDEGHMFIVMAHYEGKTLKHLIEDGTLTIERSVEITTEIAEGLHRAHQAEITHRDIKPANIMVPEGRPVKILDFGLAKLRGRTELTKSGSTLGTAGYMSPEQVTGKPVGEQSDIWSLGVVLYEMLTGQNPFEGEYDAAMAYSILNQDHAPVQSLRPEVTDELALVIDKALKKDSTERYVDVEEMLLNLRAGQDSSGIRHKVLQPAVRLPAGRKRYAAAGFVIVLLMVVVWMTNIFLGPEASPSIASLAVMPLSNESGDPNQDAFVSAMHTSLISELQKLTGLRISGRQSSLYYNPAEQSPAEFARMLGVDALVEGTVFREDDVIQITAFLNEPFVDEILWSDSFRRGLENVLQMHSEVSRAIAASINLTLTPQENAALSAPHSAVPAAVDLFLQGEYNRVTKSRQGLERSVELYEQAIERDSSYANAYSSLAESWASLAFYVSPHVARPLSKQAAEKALAIDPTQELAHSMLANYELFYTRNWFAAERHFQRALELNPSSPEARVWYAFYLAAMEREEESLEQLDILNNLDPFNPSTRFLSEFVLLLLERYDESIEMSLATTELFSRFPHTRVFRGLSYALNGEMNKAIEDLDFVFALSPTIAENPVSPVTLAFGTYAYVLAGRADLARGQLEELKQISADEYICGYEIGIINLALGETDEAFRWFDRALSQSAECLPIAKIDPRLDTIKDDPRYLDFLQKIGFEP